MAFNLINSTKEERQGRIAECTNRSSDLQNEISSIKNVKIAAIEAKVGKLKSENAEKLNIREAVDGKISSAKRKGNWVIFLGVVVIIAALLFLTEKNIGEELAFLRIVGAVVGIVVVVLGIILRGKWKKYADEKTQSDHALAEYDRTQNAYANEIKQHRNEIRDLEMQIKDIEAEQDRIREFEKYEKYYKWEASIEKGYIAAFATSEFHAIDDSPREPKEGKKYDRVPLTGLEIYMDEMLYAGGGVKSFSSQNGILAMTPVEEGGTHKLQIRVVYQIGDNCFDRVSKPLPISANSPSQFMWYHVSTCAKGTEIYVNSYDSFDDLREAVALTKEEIMRML